MCHLMWFAIKLQAMHAVFLIAIKPGKIRFLSFLHPTERIFIFRIIGRKMMNGNNWIKSIVRYNLVAMLVSMIRLQDCLCFEIKGFVLVSMKRSPNSKKVFAMAINVHDGVGYRSRENLHGLFDSLIECSNYFRCDEVFFSGP